MNIFETVKQSVTTRQATAHYGIRVGRNGMACCPVHKDRKPSMKVDERYYCFGCGVTGDVIDFVASLHNLGKRDAGVIQAWLNEHEDKRVCSLMIFKEALDNPYVKPKKSDTDQICEIMNTSIVGWVPGPTTRFADYGTQC